MARIVLGSWMVRYPLGGNLSWVLQYLTGFKELGHEIYFVEKYAYPNSCYDPVKKVMSNNCSHGIKTVADLLGQYGLENKWCFVEAGDIYHGLSKKEINEVFQTADLYIESGAHGAWDEESSWPASKVYIDVDPGYCQFKWHNNLQKGTAIPAYDHYFTNGLNIGKEGNIIPTLNINWKYIFNPVNTSLFEKKEVPEGAPYSTIMNWKSYESIAHNGITYGQKDIEFEKFISLPGYVTAPLEVAVSGLDEKKAEVLQSNGWCINDAQKVTFSLSSFKQYLSNCKAEFSVCKNIYTATSSGWFSDKSAAYLASGRPVIVQETGFSEHLPVGEGLFAVSDVYEAKNAIESVEANYERHTKNSLEIAYEYLESKKVLQNFLDKIGV